MNRSSDVFYDLKTLLQARQGLLSGWPTPTYCDVIGASCETYDLHDHDRTSLPRRGAVIRAAESAIKREWAKLSSVNGAAVLYHCAVQIKDTELRRICRVQMGDFETNLYPPVQWLRQCLGVCHGASDISEPRRRAGDP